MLCEIVVFAWELTQPTDNVYGLISSEFAPQNFLSLQSAQKFLSNDTNFIVHIYS